LSVLQLARDILSHKLSVRVDFLDLFYFDLQFLLCNLLDLGSYLVDIRPLGSNQYTGTRAMYYQGDALRMADDLDFRYIRTSGLLQLEKPTTDSEIFVQGLRILARFYIPVRAPVLIDTNP